MAKGRSTASGWLVAGLLVLIILVSTGVWNPFPAIWNWINTSATLADPTPKWQERLGGVPVHVLDADGTVIVEQRESVEGRSLATGAHLWQQEADWTALAGSAGRTVVVTGKLLVKGYRVLDPRTGNQLRKNDKAAAVWTFADAMIDVTCRTSQDCVLTAREPASGDEKWRADLPGVGFVLFADNPDLPGLRPFEVDQADGSLTGSGRMPRYLGFPIDDEIHLVDTRTGEVVNVLKNAKNERVYLAGGRVLHSEAKPISGGCEQHLIARDPITNRVVWRLDGFNLGTISGAACDQRSEPRGAGSALLATRPDGRQVLLDAADGRQLLVAPEGAKIIATDGVRAVLRSKDGKTLTAYQLGEPDVLWSRKADPKANVSVTRTHVVVFDRKPDRIRVLAPDSGQPVVEAASEAKVLALLPQGLLLGDHRDLGLLTFPSVQP
ncbi:MAG: PQQ-binding-like beta-propeller repeat protein [Hamadaea sp.]|nr:PQQ-binding-like beta-propeller repeat protein [Hamadaea sp.]